MLENRVLRTDELYQCSYCNDIIREGEEVFIELEKDYVAHPICKEKQEALEKIRVISYTTASDRYDGFGTRTEAIVAKDERGREVRKVSTPPEYVEWQRMRYASGNTPGFEEYEYQQNVKYKFWFPLS